MSASKKRGSSIKLFCLTPISPPRGFIMNLRAHPRRLNYYAALACLITAVLDALVGAWLWAIAAGLAGVLNLAAYLETTKGKKT
jgi:hypothetical protein